MADVTRLVTIYKVATANIRDVLFEGEVGNYNGTSANLKISISNSYKEYDILGFYIKVNAGGAARLFYREIPIELFEDIRNMTVNDTVSLCWGYGSFDDVVDFINTTTDTELIFNARKSLITKIVGIKYVTVGTLIDNNNNT